MYLLVLFSFCRVYFYTHQVTGTSNSFLVVESDVPVERLRIHEEDEEVIRPGILHRYLSRVMVMLAQVWSFKKMFNGVLETWARSFVCWQREWGFYINVQSLGGCLSSNLYCLQQCDIDSNPRV